MIRLPNGRVLEHVAASGALGYDGSGWPHERPLCWLGLMDPRLFAAIIKTLTYEPRAGELRWWCPWRCVRLIPGGTVNAVRLTNMGIKQWMHTIAPTIDAERQQVVGSILAESLPHLREMARMFNDVDVVALEVNLKCPNTEDEALKDTAFAIKALEAVKRESRHPVLAKVGLTHNMEEIAPRVRGAVDAFDINSVNWATVFPGKKSPLARLGGGAVSGKAAQVYTWGLLRTLMDISPIPVIGPSVWEYEDINRLRTLGAQAVSFGAIHIPYPWKPTAFVRRDIREGRSLPYKAVA